jgi:hypothetical protein
MQPGLCAIKQELTQSLSFSGANGAASHALLTASELGRLPECAAVLPKSSI